MTHARCSKCKELKLLGEFGLSKRAVNGHDSWCKRCQAERYSKYRKDNLLKVIAASKTPSAIAKLKHRIEINKPSIRAYQAKYRENNREKCNEANKTYRLKNKERVLEMEKGYRKTRAVYQYEYCMRRNASKVNATPQWANLQNIRHIYAKAKQLNRSGNNVHVDHIVPLKSDRVCGLHVEHNLQILPATENIAKRNHYWPDMPD